MNLKTSLKIVIFLVGVVFASTFGTAAFSGPKKESAPKCEKCARDPADGKVKCKPVPCP